jgi:hypothetical protein
MNTVRTLALSLIASAAATYLLRQLLSAQSHHVDPGGKPARPYASTVVVVPIIAGNSGNHLFHIERKRGFFR